MKVHGLSNKIRVVFFAEMLIEDLDGSTRTMFQLLKRIDPERFDFLFICGVGPEKIMGFPCVHIPAFKLPINYNYSMSVPLLARTRLFEILRKFNPHVLHIATPSLLGNFAINYAQNHQLPVLSIYHTHFISYVDYYFSQAPFLVNPIKSSLMSAQRYFYNHCDKIYFPSQSIAEELIKNGIHAFRTKIWKRGIDLSIFSPLKRSESFIQNITGNQNKNILFVSRLVWEKNLQTLIDVFNLIKRSKLPFNLIIAGDGLARTACEAKMSGAFFMGALDHEQLSKLYASADLFLFPSVSETYGNVVVEAMASGLPCVIADGGGSKDFVDQGVTGFKCEPYNPEDYLAKIIEILRNPPLAKQMSQAGILLSKQTSWDTLAKTYFQDLEDLSYSKNPHLNIA